MSQPNQSNLTNPKTITPKPSSGVAETKAGYGTLYGVRKTFVSASRVAVYVPPFKPTNLHHYLKANNFYVNNRKSEQQVDISECSHFLIDGWEGGKVKVPHDRYEEFLDHFAQSVINPDEQQNLCVSEQRTPVFKLFADFDFKHPNLISDALQLQYLLDFQKTVKRFYPADGNFEMLVFRTPVQKIQDNPVLYKYALHPVFPCLWVNREQALWIREAHLAFCNSTYGPLQVKAFMWKNAQGKTVSIDSNSAHVPGKSSDKPSGEPSADKPIDLTESQTSQTSQESKRSEDKSEDNSTTTNNQAQPPSKKPKKINPTNSWATAWDENVYVGNGLRMIGCIKIVTCDDPDCHTPNKTCLSCNGWKKVRKGRVYSLWQAYSSHGEPMPHVLNIYANVHQDFVQMSELVQIASIRNYKQVPQTPGFKVFDSCPYPPLLSEKKTKLVKYDETGMQRIIAEEVETRSSSFQMFRCSAENRNVLQAFIQTHINPKRYGHLTVRCLRINKLGNTIKIFVSGEGQHFCMNYKRERHNSVSIYFVMTPSGIVQKCGCRCDDMTDRVNGLCKDFKSKLFVIPDTIKLAFFGHMSTRLGIVSRIRQNVPNPYGEFAESEHACQVRDIVDRLIHYFISKGEQEKKQNQAKRRKLLTYRQKIQALPEVQESVKICQRHGVQFNPESEMDSTLLVEELQSIQPVASPKKTASRKRKRLQVEEPEDLADE